MDIQLTLPEYSGQGVQLDWEEGLEIKVELTNAQIILSANKARLISLAKHMLNLAQEMVPAGCHLHFDEHISLEKGSIEIVIEKK